MTRTVVFAIPTYGQHPSFHFTRSAIATLDLCKNAGIVTQWNFRPGDPYISKCRSALATEFLTEHKAADDLFFLDDDVGWDAKAVLRILGRDEDVIAGVYPKKQDAEDFPVELLFDEKTMQPIRRDHLVLAALVPTGFLRIKRHVLEACAEQSGIYVHPDSRKTAFDCYDLFRNGFIADQPDGRRGRWWGEDFFFSYMVRQLGFEIWVDPDIEFTHSGSHTWRGNFSKALAAKESLLSSAA